MSARPQRPRVDPVDLLRGLVMVIMALDHVRDFFGGTAISPTNLATTTVPLFLTRWVTHICAPTFFLLTGTSAYFVGRRRSRGSLARFLFTRGVWLVLLDAVFVRCFAFQFNLDYHVTVLNVLWALGWSMVALSALVALPLRAVLGIGIVTIAAHNLLDPIRPAAFGSLAPLWTVLHVQGFLVNRPGFVVLLAYPLIPWIGVTAAGFALGQVFEWPAASRVRFLWRAGLAASCVFVVLRWVNGYGDPSPWAVQPTTATTIVSFLNTTKYPPSLLFLLMTLGPALILLAAFERGVPRLFVPLRTFGRVPLFYFIGHLVAIHLAAVAVCAVRYGAVHWMFESPDLAHFPITEPPGWPLRLPGVYAIWAGIVALMYLPCRWYAAVKARSARGWLSYF
jgi:uncharacterized membrane protein